MNPVLDLFFTDINFKPYLDNICDYFERGYDLNKITELSLLYKIFKDPFEVVRRIIIKEYYPFYNDCKTFTELRFAVLKDLLENEIKNKIKEKVRITFSVLLKRFDGLKDFSSPQRKTRIISYLFHSMFNKTLSDYIININLIDGRTLIIENKCSMEVLDKYNYENLRLYNKDRLFKDAINILKVNICWLKNTRYSVGNLCRDLNLSEKFLHKDSYISKHGYQLIQKYTNSSFNDLVIIALNLRTKAINLVRKNFTEIVLSDRFKGYNSSDLFLDLNFDSIIALKSFRVSRDSFFRKFLGFSSWKNLIYFVKEKYFSNQNVNWEINFKSFFEFYKKHPNKPLIEYYNKFFEIKKGTIFSWITKSKALLSNIK